MTGELAAPAASEASSVPANTYDFSPEVVPQLRNQRGPVTVRRERRQTRFSILEERVHGRRLVWLDNAATTQKPQSVIDRISYFYEHENSKHPSRSALLGRASNGRLRGRTRQDAPIPECALAEEHHLRARREPKGINLVAQSWGRRNIGAGDEIVITWLEHHATSFPGSNSAPKKARAFALPVNDRGRGHSREYESCSGPRPALVSFTQVFQRPRDHHAAREMVEIAHRYGARVHVDGAQAVSHMPVDVQLLGCDFYSFSGHKVFGADRHRRRLWNGRRLGGHASLARWRQHDCRRHVRKDGLPAAAGPLSEAGTEHRRRRWDSGRARLRQRPRSRERPTLRA